MLEAKNGEFTTVTPEIEKQADTLRNNVNYYLRRFQEAQQELQAFIHQNGLSNSEWTLVVPKKVYPENSVVKPLEERPVIEDAPERD